MAELAFGHTAEQELATPYTQQFYPVLGVLNGPSSSAAESKLTAYGRQVGRSMLKYFRGSDIGQTTDSSSDYIFSGWDPVGPGRGPRWQTVLFERVDDIPRRKSRTQQANDQREDLSPRSNGGILSGEGLMTPKWVERQQRRPATVISLHMLQDGADSRLAEEMARNRVCLAAFGISYTAVVIINRGAAEDNTEARLSVIMQRGGLEVPQFAVCRPGSAPQFQRFLSELERSVFARATAFYAEAFMHSQSKLALIPQLPLPERPEDPESVRQSLIGTSESHAQSVKLMSDENVVRRYSRFLPLRGWLVRYHFKLGVFAECSGDRDTAQRCMWLAYAHLAAYIGEIAAGAYLPQTESAPESGWMWELNGSDNDGQRAQRLRMFGQRWDEALQLFEALHVRLVRGWLYQSLDVNALRATQSGSSGGWPYSFSGGGSGSAQRYTVAPVYRSGPSATAAAAASRAPVPISPGGNSPGSPPLANGAGGNGSLDPLVLSVHAGEVSAATELLMDTERVRRKGGAAGTVSFVSLGSETRDIDLLEIKESRGCGWWPLGGFYAVVDFGRGQQASRMGLVLNSSQDVGCTASMLPAENPYDTSLTLAGRQCAEHVVLLARILQHSGFGEDSSYFWACLERQYCLNAALYLLAAGHGMGFARALNRALLRLNSDAASAAATNAQVSNMLMSSLRQPLPARAASSAGAAAEAHGRPRAPSTAFTGFAFDQALGSIYAVVEPKRASDVVSAVSSGEDSLFPQWMWPESAAPLFDAAALASLQRCRQLAVEADVYGPGASSKDRQRVFSANPGVENTYMSAWLNAERQRNSEVLAGSRVCHLLAAALASTDGSSQASHAARAVAAQAQDLGSLIGLFVSREHGPVHFYMHLASEIAEVYAESELYAPALQVFRALADQFRAEGWSKLTAHALQWVYKCAMSTEDRATAVHAAVELLSPQLGISDSERARLEAELPSMAAGMATVSINMAQIYAPIRCHAQWRHWELGDSETMHFQVAVDCSAMRHGLPLRALTIEFSDPQFNITISGDTDMSVSDVEFAGSYQKARMYNLDGSGSPSVLELQPECVSVFQGTVDFGGADSWRWQNGILAIERVTADVASNVDEQERQLRLQLQWPTCAEALLEDNEKVDDSFVENALARIEKQLLGNIGVSRARGSSLVAQGQLKLKLPLPSDDEVPALKRAIRVAGPASSLPPHYKWLRTLQDETKVQWMQLPMPPLIAGSTSEPAFSTYSRCRVLAFPQAEPALAITLPSVKALTPAYYGEAFPVEIEVRNTHSTWQLTDVAVDLQLRVIDPNVESEDDVLVKESSQADAKDSAEHGGLTATPWLQLCQETDDKSAEAVHKMEGISCGDLLPLKSHTFTVYVHFPDAALHGAKRTSTASSVITLQCTARYSSKSQQNTESVSVQAVIPAVRPLCAEVEPMPSHVPAPEHLQSAASASITSSGYVAATAISGTGEYCFRRPMRVRLSNSGPWAVEIKRIALRPPLLDVAGVGTLPLRVQVAASTALEQGTLEAKTSQEQLIWLDIYTSDVVRMPEEVCPGTLEVQWRRFDGATALTRMWLPPLRLVQRCIQVEMSPSEAVAQVGQPMLLKYCLLNATRKVQTVEAAMHAAEGFVFAGPRRATLTLLPGDVGLLRFNVLPLAPLAAPGSADGGAKHVPNLALLGLPSQQARTEKGVPGNATGLGWVLLPRLDVRIADIHRPRSRASSVHSPVSPSATTLRSLANSAVAAVAGTPPPTRELSSLSLDSTAKRSHEAQHKIALLAGLSAEDAASLSPVLAASSADMLPAYMLDEATVAGVESDFEDSDYDTASVQLPSHAVPTDGSATADEIVRYDQSSIFCVP